MFTGDFSLGSKKLVDVDNRGGDDAEKQTETKDDGVSNSKRQRSRSLGKERLLSFILQEWRDGVVSVGEVDKVSNFGHGG